MTIRKSRPCSITLPRSPWSGRRRWYRPEGPASACMSFPSRRPSIPAAGRWTRSTFPTGWTSTTSSVPWSAPAVRPSGSAARVSAISKGTCASASGTSRNSSWSPARTRITLHVSRPRRSSSGRSARAMSMRLQMSTGRTASSASATAAPAPAMPFVQASFSIRRICPGPLTGPM